MKEEIQMKKTKKSMYVLVPVLLVLFLYGFQGNVMTTFAKVITTIVDVPTQISTLVEYTSGEYMPGAINTVIQTVTEIEVPDDVVEQVVPTRKPTPQNDYGTFLNYVSDSITKLIEDMASGIISTVDKSKKETAMITIQDDRIVIDAKEWISFNRKVYQSIADAGKEVTILYTYDGVKYSVTIPAGYDVMSLVNEDGYCGFLNLAGHLGATIEFE